MDQERLEMLIQSYGLEYILEALDLEPTWVVEYLILQGEINEVELNELFD